MKKFFGKTKTASQNINLACNKSSQNKSLARNKKRLKISPLYFIMALVMFFMGDGYDLVIYTVCIILHELAHAEAAERLGYSLTTLKLMPYGASITGNLEGIKQQDEILIALCGPLFNVFLAVPAIALWWLIPTTYMYTHPFVVANIAVVLLNLLPVFPLDGGRIMLAALTKKMSRNKAYGLVRISGYVFSIVFALLFVLSGFYRLNPTLAIIAGFMFVSAVIPDKNSKYERLYSMAFFSERLKKGLPVRELLVDGSCTLLSLSRMLSGSYYTKFTVMDGSMHVVKTLTETQLEQFSLNFPPQKKVAEIINVSDIL